MSAINVAESKDQRYLITDIKSSTQQVKKFEAIGKIENPSKRLNEMAKLLQNIRECPPKYDKDKLL